MSVHTRAICSLSESTIQRREYTFPMSIHHVQSIQSTLNEMLHDSQTPHHYAASTSASPSPCSAAAAKAGSILATCARSFLRASFFLASMRCMF